MRRDIHRHPELGFQEFRTAGVIARELHQLGLEVTTGVAKTGVVAILEGDQPGPTILVRFDIDGLPVSEETGAEYASQEPGRMHACGHDGHVAVGLTVARLLSNLKADLAGKVKFIFQPAEEGLGGAEVMVKEGVLQNPRPKYCLALHIWNERPVGWLGFTAGPVMAAADFFWVKIDGKGGHGASPQQTIDPVMAAVQWISAVQTIVSRNVPPLETAVVSVTSVKAGETFNVIPPAAEIQGTIRTFEPEIRKLIVDRFQTLLHGICTSMGCTAQVEYSHRCCNYPLYWI
jgi:amidohydrolase